MSKRREHILRIQCKHTGCKEWSFYSYSTLRDYREAVKRGAGSNWKCVRHSDDRLLTPEKLTSTRTLISGKSKNYPELTELFWSDGGGFAHGSSWKAFAKDFPEGTQIIETVQVILPNERKPEDAT